MKTFLTRSLALFPTLASLPKGEYRVVPGRGEIRIGKGKFMQIAFLMQNGELKPVRLPEKVTLGCRLCIKRGKGKHQAIILPRISKESLNYYLHPKSGELLIWRRRLRYIYSKKKWVLVEVDGILIE